MALLDRPAAKVAKLIRRFGKPITYIQVTGGKFNTATQKTDGGMEEEFPIVGTVSALNRKTLGAGRIFPENGGQVVQKGELVVTVIAADLPGVPNIRSALVIDGVRHKIAEIKPLYSGANIATYNLTARR